MNGFMCFVLVINNEKCGVHVFLEERIQNAPQIIMKANIIQNSSMSIWIASEITVVNMLTQVEDVSSKG